MPQTHPSAPAGEGPVPRDRGLSRRTMMTGAAWSVPAVVAISAAPAFATSGPTRTVTVTTADMRVVASGQTQVKAQVKVGTAPSAGEAVSFSGPSGSSFSPPTPTTDSSGTANTNVSLSNTWAKPGSTITVTATAGSTSASAGLTVTGANLLAAGSGYGSTLVQEALVFPSPIVQMCASDYSASYALLQDGTVWAKGQNGSGQLGDGTNNNRNTWAQIPGLTGVKQLESSGQGGFALLTDGTVRAWGANQFGQCGDGSMMDRSSPVTVMANSTTPLSGVTQIAGGYSSGHALMSDGTVKSWGANDYGQLGDGSGSTRVYATNVVEANDPDNPNAVMNQPLSNITQIATGRYTAYALVSDGTVWGWGYNANGQVGNGRNGNSANQSRAMKVRMQPSGPGVTFLTGVKAVTGGSFSGYALMNDGTVQAWGRNQAMELGNMQASSSGSNWPVPVDNLNNVAQMAGGREFAAALQTDGTVMTWGSNNAGQLANAGGSQARGFPMAVSDLQGQTVKRISTLTLAMALFLVTNT